MPGLQLLPVLRDTGGRGKITHTHPQLFIATLLHRLLRLGSLFNSSVSVKFTKRNSKCLHGELSHLIHEVYIRRLLSTFDFCKFRSKSSSKLKNNSLFPNIKDRKDRLTNPNTRTQVSIFVPTSSEALLFISLVSLPNLNSEKKNLK